MALHERRSLLRNLRRGFHDRRERRRTSVRGRRRGIFPCRHQRHVATSRPFQKGRLPQGILWPSGWILPQGVQQAPAGRGDQGTITVPACPGGLGSAEPRWITHSTQLKGTIKNWRSKDVSKSVEFLLGGGQLQMRLMSAARLRPGDLVEVKAPEEILETLDADGTVDQLPFMPEMVEFCGKRFRVSRRVLKTCNSGPRPGMAAFRGDDVVLIDGLRCSGADHDGCQKACVIFWRESWLRKVEDEAEASVVQPAASEQLRARLKPSFRPNTYFCQASELLRATRKLTKLERY